MAQFRCFQPTVFLPIIQEMTLGYTVTQWANEAVLGDVQANGQESVRFTLRLNTSEQRATIGKYASEHRNEAAVKQFKAVYDEDSRYLTD